jgi:hypothetical protein
MHVKYRQDNLYRMTWYTGTRDCNSHGLTIHVSFMVKRVCYTGLWIHWFCDHGATIPNGLVTIRQTSLVGVSHSRLDSIVSLMLHMVCSAIVRALTLYYRSLGTALTLLRRGNISGRPYFLTMTVIYIIYIYHLLYIYHI